MTRSLGATALALTFCLPSLALADPDVKSGPRLNVARKGHHAIRLYDGRVLIVGGVDRNTRGAGAELYDPRRNRFTEIETSDDRFRGRVTATLLADGRVAVSNSQISDGFKVWIFDPQTDRFTRGGPTSDQWHGAAARMRDGRVVLVGTSNKVHVYDSRSDELERLGGSSMDYTVTKSTATRLRGGETVVWTGGGVSDKFGTSNSNATQLITASGIKKSGKLKTKRREHAATAVGWDSMIVVGGKYKRWFRTHPVSGIELFDLDEGSWRTVDNLDDPRWGCAVTRDGNEVVITGGADRSDELRSVEVYSVRLKRLTTERFNLRERRAYHTCTRLRSGELLVVGGERDGKRLRSSELVDR